MKKILYSADAEWYRKIAATGYDRLPAAGAGANSVSANSVSANGVSANGASENRADALTKEAHNWVFFPLYPMMLRALAALNPLPNNAGWLGFSLAANGILFFLSLMCMYRYALLQGLSEVQAERALWLLCFFPTSYFFSTPHTESLFLFLLIGSLLSLELDRPVLSGAAFCLAAICRPVGMLMLPAFAVLLYQKRQAFSVRGMSALLLAPAGLLLYSNYIGYLTGDPLAFVHNQLAWGRGQGSFATLFSDLMLLKTPLILPWNFIVLNLTSAVLSAGAAIALLRRREYALSMLIGLPLAASLSTGTLQSLGRFTVTLVPIFLVLSLWCEAEDGEGRNAERLLLAVFAAGLALMTAAYAFHVTAAMA